MEYERGISNNPTINTNTNTNTNTIRSVSIDINNIFEKNKLDDLNYFLNTRRRLNQCNLSLIRLFHIIQTAGILTTTIAAGYDVKYLVWIGVGLNCIASLLHFFEKTNKEVSKKMLKDIVAIKNNKYIDESDFVFENITTDSIDTITKDFNRSSINMGIPAKDMLL